MFKRPPLPPQRGKQPRPSKRARATGPSPCNPLYWPISPVRGGFKKKTRVYTSLERLAVKGRKDRQLQIIIAANCSASAPFLSDPPVFREAPVANGKLHPQESTQLAPPFATDVPLDVGGSRGEGSPQTRPLKRKRGTREYPGCDDDDRVYKKIKLDRDS